DRGINSGVDAMLATVRGEVYRGTGRTVAQARRNQDKGWLIPLFAAAFLFGILPAFIVIALRRKWITPGGNLGSSNPGTSFTSSGSDSSSSSSWSSSDTSSSSDSSSSFSGGGGSGGGG